MGAGSRIEAPPEDLPRVVIVGGGFAGLAAAKALAARPRRPAKVHVLLVDRHNHHVFTPFLYGVATAQLAPSDAARPFRALLGEMPNVEFRMAEVSGINFSLQRVESDRGPIGYDYLIVAAGAIADDLSTPGLAGRSFGLGDLGAAEELRNHVLSCFEAAAWATDPAERARQLTFVVVGGGPTGVELAAALSQLVTEVAREDFPADSIGEMHVVLLEAGHGLLGSFAPKLQGKVSRSLRLKGVVIERDALAVAADQDGVVLDDGRRIGTATVVWAAGMRANPLSNCFPATGSHARVIVGRTLQVERHPEVLVIGDIVEIPGEKGTLPMSAQVAVQSGEHAARSVLALSRGQRVTAFSPRDLVRTVVLGRRDAIVEIGRVGLSGRFGWLIWLVLSIARTDRAQAVSLVVRYRLSGFVSLRQRFRIITEPTPPSTTERATRRAVGDPASTGGSRLPARADLPSVNVANAKDFGRVAALAWWSQDYPGLRPEPTAETTLEILQRRALRLRQALSGDKSKTTNDVRG